MFKIVSAYKMEDVTKQVKFAAIQNGFRVNPDQREPIIRDGLTKLFYSCHMKPNGCIFRV